MVRCMRKFHLFHLSVLLSHQSRLILNDDDDGVCLQHVMLRHVCVVPFRDTQLLAFRLCV